MNRLVSAIEAIGNVAYTENGALSNKTALNANLELFAKAATRRNKNIEDLLKPAWREDRDLATVITFYTRNPRGTGQGERDVFRKMLKWMYENDRERFYRVFPLVPDYGRWDDLFAFIDDERVMQLIVDQFNKDVRHAEAGQPTSLLPKFMSAENATSPETKKEAYKFMRALGVSPRNYRKMLVASRKGMKLLETLMSAKRWSEIDYSAIPSNAHTKHRAAFYRNDETRYKAYLESVKKGEKKINAGVSMPHELFNLAMSREDATIQAQWNALPDYIGGSDRIIMPVVDMSGSMKMKYIGESRVEVLTAAMSLGFYMAERMRGPLARNLMTFDDESQFVTFDKGDTVNEAYKKMTKRRYGAGTNLISVFEKLLETAILWKVPPEDMPTDICILSDMQFNPVMYDCADIYGVNKLTTNFKKIKEMYRAAGYKIPMIVFWYLNARVQESPITKYDENTVMVGGLSPSIMKTVFTGKSTSPVEMMLEVLADPKFDAVRAAIL